MRIIYNPKDGAPITDFIAEGKKLKPHFPDGYMLNSAAGPIKSNGLMQYPDSIADELLDRYGFLEAMTVDQAKKIMSRPADPEFKCDFPGCDFSTTHKVALAGHTKSHAKDKNADGTPIIDPLEIPVAIGIPTSPLANATQIRDNNEDADIANGPDKDGVDWYGEGAVVSNKSQVFGAVKEDGKGHFVG
jgi:hypothetical protein